MTEEINPARPEDDGAAAVKASKRDARGMFLLGATFLFIAAYQAIRMSSAFPGGSVSNGIVTILIDYSPALVAGALLGLLSLAAIGVSFLIESGAARKCVASRTRYERSAACKRRTAILVAVTVAGLMMVYLFYGSSGRYMFMPIAEYEGAVPFPLLEQIAPEESLFLYHQLERDEGTRYNNSEISTKSGYAAPVIILTRQSSHRIAGGTEGFGFAYGVSYHEMRTEKLAIRYEKELRAQMDANPWYTIRERADLHVDGFDSAVYYATEDAFETIEEHSILRAGPVVISVFYYGSSSLYDQMDQFGFLLN